MQQKILGPENEAPEGVNWKEAVKRFFEKTEAAGGLDET